MSDVTPLQTARRGLVDMFPIIVGGIPFGLIAGVAASDLALSAAEATAVSATIFAGAAQLATFDLLGREAPMIVVFFTAVIINARFALYSAAIAPTFARESRWTKLLCAYLLTDQAYALTAARRLKTPDAEHPVAYYLGSAAALWVMWITSTFVGAYAGAAIPASWSLDFAVPLCFVALLLPAIADRAQVVCAIVTVAGSVLALGAPHGTGIMISVALGIAGGVLFDRLGRRAS